MTPVEFRGDLSHQKTRVPGVSCGVVCMILRFAVLVEHRLVTDGQTRTDGRTDTGSWLVPRMHSTRGKNRAERGGVTRKPGNFEGVNGRFKPNAPQQQVSIETL